MVVFLLNEMYSSILVIYNNINKQIEENLPRISPLALLSFVFYKQQEFQSSSHVHKSKNR